MWVWAPAGGGGAITAVYSALAAGTVHAVDAVDDLAATMAAEDLMNRILADDPARIESWDGHEESAGALVDADGAALAGGIARVGRRANVDRLVRRLGDGPRIPGWTVRVDALDANGRTLGSLERWIPAIAETGS